MPGGLLGGVQGGVSLFLWKRAGTLALSPAGHAVQDEAGEDPLNVQMNWSGTISDCPA